MAVISSLLDPENLNMIIQPSRASVINGNERVQRMLHEQIEIKCFYEGASTLMVGSQTVNACAGDVVVINPYELHATVSYGEELGKYHLLLIPLDFFSGIGTDELELRSLLLAEGKRLKSFFQNDGELSSIIFRIVTEYEEKKPAFRSVIKGLVAELFAILLRRGLEEKSATLQHGDILRSYLLIEPALRSIRNDYSEELTTDRLAELCKISKYYFCRTFKAVTKKTAMEYLRDYRLEVADVILGNTDKSVMLVAELCGFPDVNYFCRCYKARYGSSPSTKRKVK